jgi:hypothetical protein
MVGYFRGPHIWSQKIDLHLPFARRQEEVTCFTTGGGRQMSIHLGFI